MPADFTNNRMLSKKYKRWVTFRKAIQYAFLALFFGVLITMRTDHKLSTLGGIMVAFDPFTAILNGLSSRSFLAVSSFSLLTLLLTLTIGRVWCGWICPLGTILDILDFRKSRKGSSIQLEGFRTTKYIILWAAVILALLSNLTLLILDPLTILFRTGTITILPILDQLVSSLEKLLYPLPVFSNLITRFDALIRPAFLPVEPVVYRALSLYAILIMVVIGLSYFSTRFWCRNLCPLGALLGLLSRFSLFRRTVNSHCNQCKLCEGVCPTGTISAAKNYASDPAECTQCLECFRVCPHNAVTLSASRSPAAKQGYDPARRKMVLSGIAALGWVGVFKAGSHLLHPHPQLLRPPGAVNDHLLSTCIRCGVCMRVCPTAALQPGLSETGLEGLWTPILIPEFGYCEYSCNACGVSCPTGSIPPLSLAEKQIEIIGKAYIDENRCIAWSDHQDCIVCEEMCPLPDKAIILEESKVTNARGERVKILLPKVARDRCIGCGICEYKCPVNGQAAVQVFISGDPIPS